MKRVLILGCPGSGKSTFARRLAQETGLSLIHLDQLYWDPGWIETDREVWERKLAHTLTEASWIIDGNYGNTLALRLLFADTAVLLDFPRGLCLVRVFRRVAIGWGRSRADMQRNCPEHFSLEFFRYIWSFRREQMPAVLAELERFAGRVVIVRTQREAEMFLSSVQRKDWMDISSIPTS